MKEDVQVQKNFNFLTPEFVSKSEESLMFLLNGKLASVDKENDARRVQMKYEIDIR